MVMIVQQTQYTMTHRAKQRAWISDGNLRIMGTVPNIRNSRRKKIRSRSRHIDIFARPRESPKENCTAARSYLSVRFNIRFTGFAVTYFEVYNEVFVGQIMEMMANAAVYHRWATIFRQGKASARSVSDT